MGQLNPTRQEILDAHKALEIIVFRARLATPHAEDERDYEQLIRSFLPPLPRPTMAEIEWDDEKHYLAEAEHSTSGKVTMLSKASKCRDIYYLRRDNTGSLLALDSPEKLTPTGRRYVLQEEE